MVIIRSIQIIATRATRIRPARWVWPTRRLPAGRLRAARSTRPGMGTKQRMVSVN